MKPSALIHALDNPKADVRFEHDAQFDALISVVAHVIFADKRLDPGEVTLLRRLLQSVEDVQAVMDEARKVPLDLPKLAVLFPDMQDRDDIITLAEHAVWGDNDVDSREWDIIDQLVDALGVVRP